jgi:aryl-alcohol dehydrogenase-like predicted oxidoreductase
MYETLNGHATPGGTKKYAEYAVQKGKPSRHFRLFDGMYLSSIGMGTYLGQPTTEDDKAMENAIYESIKSGAVNVIDSSINYRAMRSEKSIGRALTRLIKEGIVSRDEVFICTKNGYITIVGYFRGLVVMD